MSAVYALDRKILDDMRQQQLVDDLDIVTVLSNRIQRVHVMGNCKGCKGMVMVIASGRGESILLDVRSNQWQ